MKTGETKVLEVKVSQNVVRQIEKVVANAKLSICSAEGLLRKMPGDVRCQAIRDSEREHFFEIIKVLLVLGFPGAKKTVDGFDFDFDELQKWLAK